MILIEGGEVFSPEPKGELNVLVGTEKIIHVGAYKDISALKLIDQDLETLDARNCYVIPGLIDPHEHLSGGSGEDGFSTQTPCIYSHELVKGGITTVVGCLGSDTITKNMAHLLARVKSFVEIGFSALCYTGGYEVPPRCLTSDVRTDILFVKEIIGVGEVALSDERSRDPDLNQLAKIVADARVAGMLSKKAGLTHFHIGEGKNGLKHIFELMEEYEIEARYLYPTHLNRNDRLLAEGAKLTKKGCFVDIDISEEDAFECLKTFVSHGGHKDKMTFSTDASVNSPETLFSQVRDCFVNHGLDLTEALGYVTKNTAEVLQLKDKGSLAAKKDADILIVDKKDFAIRSMISRGRVLFKDGKIKYVDPQENESKREFHYRGNERPYTK
ncbi:amidohydrolase family protein [Bdellovibrio reynosensis]|uniref:Amidohydrolase family protein n=1 Tax=Bdellovibrio reynosensis TaxID=2835041 RepID=A0ABY4CGH6_9BACT|nr:amidohydrolase family protein [Bdellovibrio reynosensis]UOF02906.1 amidohydrolase family protein [Bdellovibrio reynosensis]